MKRRLLFTLAIGTMVLLQAPAVKGQDHSFWHSCGVDRERNNLWPQPFRAADSVAVYSPFDVMKTNGWKLHNTLGNCFFNEQQGLTDSGKLRLEWIVTQAPADRRQVFVMKGANGESTSARVEATQIAISQILPVGELPPIYVTDVEPFASSGQYQTAINRAMNRSTPNPRLPVFKGLNAPSSNSSTGGGSGSSSK